LTGKPSTGSNKRLRVRMQASPASVRECNRRQTGNAKFERIKIVLFAADKSDYTGGKGSEPFRGQIGENPSQFRKNEKNGDTNYGYP